MSGVFRLLLEMRRLRDRAPIRCRSLAEVADPRAAASPLVYPHPPVLFEVPLTTHPSQNFYITIPDIERKLRLCSAAAAAVRWRHDG